MEQDEAEEPETSQYLAGLDEQQLVSKRRAQLSHWLQVSHCHCHALSLDN